MGRIASGASLSVRNLPSPVWGPETEKEPPPFYLEWTNTLQMRALRSIARYYADLTRSVEEYSGESTSSATGETTLTTVPDYEPSSEIITSVLVTGPQNSPFTLQLGGRYMTLATDTDGFVLLSPVFFKLKATDTRKLTATAPPVSTAPSGLNDLNITGAIVAATAGNIVLPASGIYNGYLTGFDINLSTVGTAAMTVTVSNVPGGPFTYTILTGGSTLSVRYPAPLPGTGGNPTISWTATAAAVGNITAYGESVKQTGLFVPAPGSWFFQLSGYALARNET